MDSAPVISPSSDERFWTRLRDRVDTILDDRNSTPTSRRVADSESRKRLREDPHLLIRGLDSVASSLSQLTNTLSNAQQGANDLLNSEREGGITKNEDACPKAKRHCGSNGDVCSEKRPGCIGAGGSDEPKGGEEISADVAKSGNLKKAKQLAISMADKAALLAREMKTVKSELCFMQERCTLLEEENRRLREGLEKGDRQEEDDLVRLQLEALLAEKSRLANENSNLTRENQCLHQLVEYHQLTSQDLSSSYELAIQGMHLDFSSPLGKIDSDSEGESSDAVPCTPSNDKPESTCSLNESTANCSNK